MESKNNLLREKIYTPPLYQNLLSIIIIHQNNEIVRCLKKLCNQLYQPFEIIIIDNSTNEGYNIIDNYITNNNLSNVSLYHSNSKNLYECVNIGLTKAKGNYLAFQLSTDESSHLRFMYQIDQLNQREHIYLPHMSLCLSYSNGETFISPRSLCMTRFVFQKLGYFNHELKELCFEEYIWRFLYIFENLFHEDKDLNFLKENEFKNIKTTHKTLFQATPDQNTQNIPEIREKYNTKHKEIEINKKSSFFIEYKEEPFSKSSYLSQVNNVMKGYGYENRITLVFFTNGFNINHIKTSIQDFHEIFQCNRITTLVCHYGAYEESIESLSDLPLFEDAVFLKFNGFSDAFYSVINDYIETPYMFLLQDQWGFCKESLFHPLSYILDVIDKYPAKINSLRFNSQYNTVNTLDKKIEYTDFVSEPDIVYTSGINNEPQIINVRHAKKFKLPFINREMKGDGVGDSLTRKYNNVNIAMKLKSCLYGSLNYPPTSKNLFLE